jgi:hypothetical protein
MRAFIQDSSTSIRRRKAHLPSWLAALTAAILLATLGAGTATAGGPAAMGADDPTVISD